MRLRLSDADRIRLGCEAEWLDFDPAILMIAEAEAIQDDAGIDPDEWFGLLKGTPVIDSAGAPVLRDDGRPRVRIAPRTWRAIVWIGLRRAGVHHNLASLDFDFNAVRTAPSISDQDAEVGAGKDQPPPSTPPDPSGTAGPA